MPRAKTSRSIAHDIDKSYKQAIRQVEDSMKDILPGGKSMLDRIALIAKLRQQWREERAARGLDPQDLGNSTRKVFEFVATVTESATPVSAERERFNAEMDALYGANTSTVQDGPAAPEPASKKSKREKKQ